MDVEEGLTEAEEQEQERFRVVAYCGYQGEQEPRGLVVEGERLDVVAIQDRWYDPRARYFRVKASDERYYLLRYDLDELSWSRICTMVHGKA